MATFDLDALRSTLAPYYTLTAEQAVAFAPFVRQVDFEADAHLHRAGDVCDDFVIIHHGLVRAYYLHEAKEVNLRLLCSGSAALALSSFLRAEPSIESLQCLEASTGYVVRYRALCESLGPVRSAPIRQLLAERHYLSMERRLLMLQHKTASQRYHYFCEHMEAEVVQRTPAYHVASYLGVAPESLSRVRRDRGK